MKKFKAAIQLIIPYISIIILAMVSIGYLGGRLVNSYQEHIIEKKQITLEVAMERFQERLNAIERVGYALSQNTVIEDYLYDSMRRNMISATECLDVQKVLYNYKYSPGIFNLYLYEPKKNRIIDVDTIFSEAEEFFRYNYIMAGFTPEESAARLKNPEYEGFSLPFSLARNGSILEYMEYRIQIPADWSRENALHLVITMEAQELFEDFYDVTDEGAEFYVYDQQGTLVYAAGSQYQELMPLKEEGKWRGSLCPVTDGGETYGALYRTKDKQWYVKFVCPEFLSMDRPTVPLFGSMAILPVVAAVILSVFFTIRNYREISGVLQLLNIHFGNESKTSGDANYSSIKASVARLVDENSKYRERIEDFNNIRRVEVLDKLVRGAFGSREEITAALKEIGFAQWDAGCVVLCVRYEGSDYRKMIGQEKGIKELVKDAIPRYAADHTEVFDSAARETVCIWFAENDVDREALLRKLIAKLNVEVFYAHEIDVKIGAGSMVSSIYEASESYKQAKEVIKYRETVGSNVYLYADLSQLADNYYYPAEFDELIYNYIVAGNASHAKEILGRLYRENLERETGMLSVTAIEMLKKRLETCMISVARKYHISAEQFLSDCQKEHNINRYFQLMYRYIDWIAEEIGDDRTGSQNQLGIRIMEYINQHYSENTLSLKLIAGEFGFQENYISRMFKGMYGENLSTVIERIRIDKACQLLKNEEWKISDISLKVGYSSDISFRRAFKKVTGMTPQEYRDLKQ